MIVITRPTPIAVSARGPPFGPSSSPTAGIKPRALHVHDNEAPLYCTLAATSSRGTSSAANGIASSLELSSSPDGLEVLVDNQSPITEDLAQQVLLRIALAFSDGGPRSPVLFEGEAALLPC